MLLASLFFFDTFDNFFKYSTQNDFEYLEKLLNAFTVFSLFSKKCIFKKKKAEKFGYSIKNWTWPRKVRFMGQQRW